MTDSAPNRGADDDFVFALEPAQLGAVIALLIAVIVLWRVARKDREA